MKKILVIEDEKAVLDNICELLESEDYKVFTAENGQIGVEVAKNILPDLIISDIMMPKLDGYGVIQELSSYPPTSSIPFIFLTARADKSDLRLGMELGADDFLVKPFMPDELYRAISSRLRKKTNLDAINENKIKELSLSLAATIPHELRTPLNGILGSAQLLAEYYDTLDTESVADLHQTIYISAQRLEKLIYKYLTFVDTELILRNPEKLEFARNKKIESISHLLEDIIVNHKLKTKREFIYRLDNADVCIYEEHFSIILNELIDNACKFSTNDKPIEINTWIEDPLYCIEVKDYGVGFTQDQLKSRSMLKQFDRDKMEQQGLGLGLSLVERLINIYKGQLDIESQKDAYTKITLKIPIANTIAQQ